MFDELQPGRSPWSAGKQSKMVFSHYSAPCWKQLEQLWSSDLSWLFLNLNPHQQTSRVEPNRTHTTAFSPSAKRAQTSYTFIWIVLYPFIFLWLFGGIIIHSFMATAEHRNRVEQNKQNRRDGQKGTEPTLTNKTGKTKQNPHQQ